jgi:uncharacterized Zn-binding protein involved in type VI secretion
MSVIANNMDVAAESTGHTVVYMAPSVCITPAAPSPLPIPYPIMTPSGTGSEEDDSRKTNLQGKPIFCVGSLISSCTGNEPGTQKEVVSLKTGSKMFPTVGSPNVKVEGSAVVFTGTTGMGNKM